MKFTEIYYLERKNKGNYEHEELSAKALIDEGEDKLAAMLTLKDLVHNALYGTVNKPIEVKEETKTVEKVEAEVITPAKEKKPKEKKERVSEVTGTPVPDVIKEENPKASKVVKYSSAIPEHKSIFGGYLAKKYQESWKTASPVEEIKAFTASLNGQDFLDESGAIVPTFLEMIHSFFGA